MPAAAQNLLDQLHICFETIRNGMGSYLDYLEDAKSTDRYLGANSAFVSPKRACPKTASLEESQARDELDFKERGSEVFQIQFYVGSGLASEHLYSKELE
ncbi:hypothetical protein BST61_g9838 [Cercospora zeina]